LRKRREYLAVQRRGRRYYTPYFVLLWTHGSTPWTRLGITASRKVGRAAQRNRAKRLVREAFRRNKGQLPRAVDIVIIATKRLPQASYSEVREALLGWAREQVQRAPLADGC
jgi:ribonuclease P protein component